jgi:hypothetical protein
VWAYFICQFIGFDVKFKKLIKRQHPGPQVAEDVDLIDHGFILTQTHAENLLGGFV